jgi:Uma2 family endonuclease
MSSTAPHLKFTYQDLILFPEDGKRHELIDGDHYMTPSPRTKHQRISMQLSALLHAHAGRTKAGHVFAAPFDVVLSNLDVVEPDVLFISSARTSIITEENIQGPPDLIMEILSESTRKTDEIVKRKLYERFGVKEYWIVDPELEAVKIYRLTDQRYGRVAELSRESGDTLATPLLPGLQILLSSLFA